MQLRDTVGKPTHTTGARAVGPSSATPDHPLLPPPGPATRSSQIRPVGASRIRDDASSLAHRIPLRAYIVAGVLAVFILLLSISRVVHRAEVYPGVAAFGVPLGGASKVESRAKIQEIAARFAEQPVNFQAGGATLTTTIGAMGFSYDVDATVDDAMNRGRGFFGVSGMLGMLGLNMTSGELPVRYVFDPHVFAQSLQTTLDQYGVTAADARLAFDDSSVTIVPERDGWLADATAAERALRKQIASQATLTVPLELTAQSAAIRSEDLQAPADEARRLLSQPVEFNASGTLWTMTPDEFSPGIVVLLAVAADAGAHAALSSDFVTSLTRQIAERIDRAAVEPGAGEGGDFGRLVPAQDGLEVDTSALTALLESPLSEFPHHVDVPVTITKPTSTTNQYLANQGITDVIATGTSDFSGSEPGRSTNIDVASRLVNQILIPPGETFSYNDSIGSIVDVPGFVPAGATENGIPGTSVGGGVCQVSTTIFRAALKAGLPITEWWPHAYRSVYYEQGGWSPGFDASIQQPEGDPFGGSDLKFVNTTNRWLMVRASIDDHARLVIDLVGTPTGNRVELEDAVQSDIEPVVDLPSEEVDPALPPETVEQIQPNREGMTVTVGRHVYDSAGREISSDDFVSYYQPQSASYRVSPDKSGSTVDQ